MVKFKDQKDLHNKIRKKLVELNELTDKSEIYYSYLFDEEIDRLDITVILNNLIREHGIPKRFKIHSVDIDNGFFLGISVDKYISSKYEDRIDRKGLSEVIEKIKPYLGLMDKVLNPFNHLKLHITDIQTDYIKGKVEKMRFVLDSSQYIFSMVIEIEQMPDKYFNLAYLKNVINPTYGVLGRDDEYLSYGAIEIPAREYVENCLTIKKPSELSNIIKEDMKMLGDKVRKTYMDYIEFVTPIK